MFLRLPDKLVPLRRWAEWLWKWNLKLNDEIIPLLAVLLTLMGSVVAFSSPPLAVRTTGIPQRTFGGPACPWVQHLPFPCVPAVPRIWGQPGGWELSDLSGSCLTFYSSHTSCELTDECWLQSLICKARCPKDFAPIKKKCPKSMDKPPANGADGARFYPAWQPRHLNPEGKWETECWRG